ncbi:Deoxyribonucleoside regulator [Rhodococcoides fascians]|uniref:Deoxyribonucleoside regulator n=1 Tax=Rhodococcoides fascians TaxID=1828 RepID=A0A143QHU1_RHOFA|nr:Deoxyribonucleoside regulator [Rhodococcus fascians]NIL83960.1 Deoxyribonucleoside regulator [Rhodococcus fascians]NIL92024.1 Deoxyribonucleoside regulator [Rhodococcus fascians]CAH0130288.1 Deoxyribonucleoside regulator [Rhodococcus fascians]
MPVTDTGITPESDLRTGHATQAARLYYFQDMTMAAIGRELGVSRSTVSRLITFARASGLVEIKISTPLGQAPRIERAFADLYDIRAHVVPVAETVDELQRLDRVATFAGRLLTSFFESDMVMGVAWGTTVSAVSRKLAPKRTHNSSVVQLNGAANMRTTGVSYATDIIRTFADAYGAAAQGFPVPAFFDYPETRQHLWRERSIRRVLELQDRMNLAVFSIGVMSGAVPSHVYSAGYLEREDRAELQRDGVVGDIATVFLRSDGSYNRIALNDRSSGPSLDRLKAVPRRVAIVAGESKLDALTAALRGGLITDLVIDDISAAKLVLRSR